MKPGYLLMLICCLHALSCVAQKEYTDKKNIIFARNLKNFDGRIVDNLKCDVYYPSGALYTKKYPVCFVYHAGSFTGGSKGGLSNFCDELAESGFIVVAPDYRVGYRHSLPCMNAGDTTRLQEAIYRAMQDVNACIRYITNRAAEYGIDTGWIFIGGASAGGTLALNDAYITDSVAAVYYPESVAAMGTLQNNGNDEPFRYSLKGICAMWGAMPAWDSLINKQSALPAILYKGGQDTNTPDGVGRYMDCSNNSVVRAGLGIYTPLSQLDVPVIYHFQPNAEHAAYDDPFCIATTACFFKSLMMASPYSGFFEYYDRPGN